MKKPAWLKHGDCLSEMAAIADSTVHMVLTDLPYGTTNCRWDHKIDLAPLWLEYARLLAPGGVVALFATFPFSVELVNAAPKGWPRYNWVWDKAACTGAGNARRQPMRCHEEILIFYPKQPYYAPQGLRPCHRRVKQPNATDVYRGFRNATVQTHTGYPKSILRWPRERGLAPAEKPVGLLQLLIRTYTRARNLVLDSAMGLGSTGVAALNCGRRFAGIEIDPARFAIAAERVVEAEAERVATA